MVEKSLLYPLKGAGKFRHIVGMMLLYFSWLLYPAILLVGYYIQALTFASIGREEPPAFSQVLSLTKLGIVGGITVVMYSGVFIAVPMLVTATILSEAVTIQTLNELSVMLQVWLVVITAFSVGMALILPVILCRYGRTAEFRVIYDVQGHIKLLKQRRILRAISTAFIVTLGTTAVIIVVSVVTLGLGVLAAPLILFWYLLVTAHIYGTAIGEVTGTVQSVKYQDILEEINAETT